VHLAHRFDSSVCAIVAMDQRFSLNQMDSPAAQFDEEPDTDEFLFYDTKQID
jgi:hypothetical protein